MDNERRQVENERLEKERRQLLENEKRERCQAEHFRKLVDHCRQMDQQQNCTKKDTDADSGVCNMSFSSNRSFNY